jgi:uncharacterized BrkB/YihY/UPF0761 family membrane protein
MTLNANFSGATLLSRRRRLEGADHGLDALIGLVILIAEILIGVLVIYALFDVATENIGSRPSDQIGAGFAIALFGGGAVVVLTTLIYLVRMARRRRSWPAPLWGTILMSLAMILGYAVITG